MEINLQYQPQVLKYYVHVGDSDKRMQDIYFPFLDASKLEGERWTGMHSKSKLHRDGPAPSSGKFLVNVICMLGAQTARDTLS